MVVAGAAASLSGATRAGYAAFLAKGGLGALTAAVPVWAAGSGLEAGAFKRLLVGPALGDGAAAALQDVGRLVRGARDAGDLEAASGRLAAAVGAGGAEWRYGLRYAGDKAGYAAARGVVAPGELADGGTFRVTAAPPGGEVLRTEANWSPEQVVPGIGLPLGRHGGWGLAAGAAVGLGVAGLYLLWRSKGDTGQQNAPQPLPEPLEARRPRNETDDEEEDNSGRRRERPKGKQQRPEPEGDATPPPGDTQDLNDYELEKAAKADGYDNVDKWKKDELELDSSSIL